MSSRGEPHGDDPTLVHDHQPVAQLLGLVHVVGGQHQGHALGLQLVEPLPEEVAGLRVEAGGGLVQQHQLGSIDQRSGDGEPALHAARQRVDLVVATLGELRELEQLLGPGRDLAPRQVEVAAVDDQVVEDGQLAVQVVVLGHHPESRPDLGAVASSGPAPAPGGGHRSPATRTRSCAWSRSCPRRWGRGTRRTRRARPRTSIPSTATKSSKRFTSARASIIGSVTPMPTEPIGSPPPHPPRIREFIDGRHERIAGACCDARRDRRSLTRISSPSHLHFVAPVGARASVSERPGS